jgi:hypothetical protein
MKNQLIVSLVLFTATVAAKADLPPSPYLGCAIKTEIARQEYGDKRFAANIKLLSPEGIQAGAAAQSFAKGVSGYLRHLVDKARTQEKPDLERLNAYFKAIAKDVNAGIKVPRSQSWRAEVSTAILDGKLLASSCVVKRLPPVDPSQSSVGFCVTIDLLASTDYRKDFEKEQRRVSGYPLESVTEYVAKQLPAACQASRDGSKIDEDKTDPATIPPPVAPGVTIPPSTFQNGVVWAR